MTIPNQADAGHRARLRRRRLTGYALAAGAVVAGGRTARADIIYSGVRDEHLGLGSSLFLNLNDTGPRADAINDFVFNQFTSTSSRSITMIGANQGLPYNGERGDDQNRVYVLGLGAPVGPALTFATQFIGVSKYTQYSPALLAFSSTSGKLGPFARAQGALLGLRFQIPDDGSTHYGWARISVADDLTMTLVDWAYESSADVTILAGAVPEPAALGLLALGAAGVVSLRRGRKSE